LKTIGHHLKSIAVFGFMIASMTIHGGAFAQAGDPSLDPHAHETTAQRDARMHWWREARYGLFINMGLYSVPAGVYQGRPTPVLGEWMMHDLRIPVADYAALAKQFNPVEFNADQWVGIAKAAGMKYIVMDAKHHEGFAMFHSKVDKFNIYDATPFKRDPIAEVAAAAKKAGIKFGVYYSQAQDWHHPGGAAYGGHWDPAQDGDLHAYVKNVAAPQVKELLTEFHPAVLWWDTPVDMSPEDIRELTEAFPDDPGLIANNRLGNGVRGDTETPEQTIPANGFPGKDWETCMTMNDTWGYKTSDHNYKSEQSLLHNLIDIASKGGNYLLNVGPTGQGIIPKPEVDRLLEIGLWLKSNGESIYATTASPYKKLPFDGRVTVKGNNLYLNVFNWPESGLTLPGLQTPVKSAVALATGEGLTVTRASNGMLTISKPDLIDGVSTAIVLNLAGPPVILDQGIVSSLQADGSYLLRASDAVLEGSSLTLEGSGDSANLGFWTTTLSSVSWDLSVSASHVGKYQAHLLYSCAPGSEGSTFSLLFDGKDSGLTGTVAKTAGWNDYQTMTVNGTLTLSGGTHMVGIRPLTKPGIAVMNLRSLTLTPAP